MFRREGEMQYGESGNERDNDIDALQTKHDIASLVVMFLFWIEGGANLILRRHTRRGLRRRDQRRRQWCGTSELAATLRARW